MPAVPSLYSIYAARDAAAASAALAASITGSGNGTFAAKVTVNCAVADDNNSTFSNTSSTGYGLYSRGGGGSRYAAKILDYAGTQRLILSGAGDLTVTNSESQAVEFKGGNVTARITSDNTNGLVEFGTLGNHLLRLKTVGVTALEFDISQNAVFTASLATAAPTGGAGAWKLGKYTGGALSSSGYVTVNIDGTDRRLLVG